MCARGGRAENNILVRVLITSKRSSQRLCDYYYPKNCKKKKGNIKIGIDLTLYKVKNCRTGKIICGSFLYYSGQCFHRSHHWLKHAVENLQNFEMKEKRTFKVGKSVKETITPDNNTTSLVRTVFRDEIGVQAVPP